MSGTSRSKSRGYPGCNIFFQFYRDGLGLDKVTSSNSLYVQLLRLPITLEEKLPIAFVRRAFDHCLRFMNGYCDGLTGAVLEYAVKKYRSYRRLPPSINLFTIEEEYWEK